jgi:hypothetical protein
VAQADAMVGISAAGIPVQRVTLGGVLTPEAALPQARPRGPRRPHPVDAAR